MLLPATPLIFRKRSSRPARISTVPPAPPAPPVLIEAIYEAGGPWVRLRFDRPISTVGMDGTQIVIRDGVTAELEWEATGEVIAVDPATIQIYLFDLGPWTSPEVKMSAGANTNIVAVDGAQEWAGVSDVVLPFPP